MEYSPKLTADRDNTTDDLSNKDRLAIDCPQISFEEVQLINLEKKKKNVLKKIEMKEEKARLNFEESKKVLQSNFDVNIKKLTQHIDEQRYTVSNSYGPLSLKHKQQERPIFEIRKDVDQEGFEKQK